ncbi:hypothetical protein OW763_16325 [Clostridium aestuarii]|uniref:MORN repeat protein n=1 Tax=Clostridium aestuarii TaxID=338193 RepID=A0ABT4D3R2_9CLOT|nr:hypothetical protein [Clostridium aestuarii]MCY6485878.1 hypothetical protein [Clostridium aestuarii]
MKNKFKHLSVIFLMLIFLFSSTSVTAYGQGNNSLTEKVATTKSIAYNGGWTYFGMVDKNEKPTHQGIWKQENGTIYAGSNVNGKIEGMEHYVSQIGDQYLGKFKNSQLDSGIMVYNNGEVYAGSWIKNQKQGDAIYIDTQGNTYKSKWENDKLISKTPINNCVINVVKYNNGIYYGEVSPKKIPNGNGIFKYNNGSIYAGSFNNGNIDGFGHFIYEDGNQYLGGFSNGKRSGVGTMVYTDNTMFFGRWKDDKRYDGTLVYPNGTTYLDKWVNNMPLGKGGFTKFENGKFVGQNVAQNVRISTNNNGYTYGGEINLKNKSHGKGIAIMPLSKVTMIMAGDFTDGGNSGYTHQAFSDGSQYLGNVKDALSNGYGMNLYTDGVFYAGNWKENKRNGDGVIINRDGKIYKVTFVNGVAKGGTLLNNSSIKRLTFNNGWIYYGEVNSNNRPNGKGIMKNENGTVYAGDFVNGYISGYGHYIFPNGCQYLGEFYNNKFEGKGMMLFDKDTIYYGYWRNNVKQGQGNIISSNGIVYHDTWNNGKSSGKGDYIPLFDTYIKQIAVSGIIKTIRYENGFVYKGLVNQQGKPNGRGRLTFADGFEYEGDFKNGIMDGYGKMTFASGYIYEGEWKNNKRNGKGKLISPEGKSIELIWKDNHPAAQTNGNAIQNIIKDNIENKIKDSLLQKVNKYGDIADGIDQAMNGKNTVEILTDKLIPNEISDILGIDKGKVGKTIKNAGNDVLKEVMGEGNFKKVNKFIGDTRDTIKPTYNKVKHEVNKATKSIENVGKKVINKIKFW